MSTQKGFWTLPTEKGYRDYTPMLKIAIPSISFVFTMVGVIFTPSPSLIGFFVWWLVMAGFIFVTFVVIFGIANLLCAAENVVQSANESNMQKKNCPFCDEKISQRARICPHCRTELFSIEK